MENNLSNHRVTVCLLKEVAFKCCFDNNDKQLRRGNVCTLFLDSRYENIFTMLESPFFLRFVFTSISDYF